MPGADPQAATDVWWPVAESRDEFTLLCRYIEQTLRIQCSNYKEDYIRRRLLSRMRSTGQATFSGYLSYLRGHPAELEPLRNALTINVTEFFRDAEVYAILRTTILPELFRQKKRILIWSAGCSTGEEPYSLAMILSDMMVGGRDIAPQILATDLDEVVLARAKADIFSEKAVRKLGENQIRRYFTRLPDGNYEARKELKELIRFRPHDLMSGVPPARYVDLITCRNVTIYFTEKQKDDLARMFHAALVPGGYYVMGKTEYMGRDVEPLFSPYNVLQKIYMRKK